MNLDATQAVAWVAAASGILALVNQGFGILRNRQKDKTQMQTALDHNPLVRKQLELGNVGEAVKHLNAIIEIQAETIDNQQEEIKELRAELVRLRDRLEVL